MAVQTLTSTTPAYQTKKTVQVEPEETQRSVSYQAPTPEMQEYIQKNIIEPTQRAYGINPDTGEVTPFQALGYNPEDERKRREAEMALNDRKRKENAWYNAFAVVGDSLTAALGGNVWQRQPNRIGAQANADNQRLIAEQKAEDVNNAAMLRNAGVKYADAVNRLIQNYLTKTTTTNKTGGSRKNITEHQEVVKNREEWHKDGNDKNGNYRSYGSTGGGSKGNKIVKQAIFDEKTGKIVGYKTMTVPKIEADAYSRVVQNTLQKKFENGELNDILNDLEKAGIYNPYANDLTKRWNADKILAYGDTFEEDVIKSELDRLWTLSEEYKKTWKGVRNNQEKYDDD